jgi:hypothetical protein
MAPKLSACCTQANDRIVHPAVGPSTVPEPCLPSATSISLLTMSVALSAERGSGRFNPYLAGVTSCSPVCDRVAERRRAVALARHFREVEGLSIAQIADRLGRSPATIKA